MQSITGARPARIDYSAWIQKFRERKEREWREAHTSKPMDVPDSFHRRKSESDSPESSPEETKHSRRSLPLLPLSHAGVALGHSDDEHSSELEESSDSSASDESSDERAELKKTPSPIFLMDEEMKPSEPKTGERQAKHPTRPTDRHVRKMHSMEEVAEKMARLTAKHNAMWELPSRPRARTMSAELARQIELELDRDLQASSPANTPSLPSTPTRTEAKDKPRRFWG